MSAAAHYHLRRRLRHLARGQRRDPRSHRAWPHQCHLGDGGSASHSTAPKRRSSATLPRIAAAVGLHVTSDRRRSRRCRKILSRCADGAFLPLATTLRRAHLRSLQPKLLIAEISRQFEAFVAAFGRPPDFVDGHHHVHLFPQIRDAVLRVTKDFAPDAWVRQCGQLSARRRLTDHKALLLDGLSRRFRRLAGRSRAAHQSGLCRDLYVSLGRGLRRAVCNLPRSPARWRRHHVPSGKSRRRAETARSRHRSARARIRFLRRRRVCAPARRARRHAVIGIAREANENRDERQSCPQPRSC